MAPKFGNYLFRNLKTGADSQDQTNSSVSVPVEDQEIILRPDDFTTEIGTTLNWGTQDSREIRVKLKQTDGLMDGRITISAKVLRDLYPGLLTAKVKEDAVFPVSLRSVVLQFRNVIHPVNQNPGLPGAPDFDTPIAQVAREDEGFFKLEDDSSQSLGISQPNTHSTNEFGSVLPAIREKPQVREDRISVQSVHVVAPFANHGSPPPKRLDDNSENEVSRDDPFADLLNPRVGVPPTQTGAQQPSDQKIQPSSQQIPKPERRRSLEHLQELFLTDDFLDAGQVAQLLCGFPKVKAVLIMSDDGARLGGELPGHYKSNPALAAPALMRAVREFGMAISSAEISAFTVLADSPISIFLEGRICMLVVHEGRGLLPGMRERFREICKALDDLYDPGDKAQ